MLLPEFAAGNAMVSSMKLTGRSSNSKKIAFNHIIYAKEVVASAWAT
jgi:hypothetical protein